MCFYSSIILRIYKSFYLLVTHTISCRNIAHVTTETQLDWAIAFTYFDKKCSCVSHLNSNHFQKAHTNRFNMQIKYPHPYFYLDLHIHILNALTAFQGFVHTEAKRMRKDIECK